MRFIDDHKTPEEPSDDAIAIYNRSITAAPDNPWAYRNRAIAYRNQGQLDLAMADLNKSIALDNHYGLAYGHRGEVYDDLAKIHQESAHQDYNQALKLNPKNVSALFNRGTFHACSGNFYQAIADYDRAINLSPHESMLYCRGVCLYQIGQIESAAESFRQGLAINPNHSPSLMNIGLIIYELDQCQPAMQLFEQAFSISHAEEAKLALMVAHFKVNEETFVDKSENFSPKLFNIYYLRDQLWGPKLLQTAEHFLQSLEKEV
ncbi:tetratricopeptide repeat protein [Crocosphaera sp.]|uniref:tetratricopeptide repeat protein n=1 Tax=Crocosphaera sp. TaxID=2729996 RepID=UPI003F24789C|nr:tetratricopeptide repeat protein [Crocosphaera sp.]